MFNDRPAIKTVFVLPPKVHLLDITGPAHVFYEACDYGAKIDMIFCTIFPRVSESVSSATLAFHRLTPFDEVTLNAGDIIFVPGLDSSLLFDGDFLFSSKPFQNWLNAQYQKGVIVSSVCTGAFLIAEAGLLNARACTTHWKYIEQFKRRYPGALTQNNRLFVQDERIYTSAGVSSGIDLALYLIENLLGSHFAAQIAKEIVIYFRRTSADPQLNIFTEYRNHLDYRIHTVQDRLAEALHKKFTIQDLANEVNMSPRNLTRLFKRTTQITIGAYVDQLRVERAEKLISEGNTLDATAMQCGLKSVSQLRNLRRKYQEL